MTPFRLFLPDMACDHCVRRISDALTPLGHPFAVHQEAREITGETDDLDMLRQRLEDRGFSSEIRTP